MDSIAGVFRDKANSNIEAAKALEAAEDFLEHRKQSLWMVWIGSATLYNALADFSLLIESGNAQAKADALAAARLDKNRRVRDAAAAALASGDWSGFDEVVNAD